MAMRRVVVVAMPCTEVVDVAGILDIFYAVNDGMIVLAHSTRLRRRGCITGRDRHHVAGLRLVADRSDRAVRGSIDTLIVTGIDEPDDAKRDPELVRWLAAWRRGRGGWWGSALGRSSWPRRGCWTAAVRRRIGPIATS